MSATTDVIMPVLGMSQDTGKLVRWLKRPGERVEKGEPLMEVETDKAMMEVEAPASGVLASVTVAEGQEVPVTHVMAVIMDTASAGDPPALNAPAPSTPSAVLSASPVAARMASELRIDLSKIKPAGGRIEKSDIVAYMQSAAPPAAPLATQPPTGRVLASPKARRLALERGIDLAGLRGSGPEGAVLAEDVPAAIPTVSPAGMPAAPLAPTALPMPLKAGLAAGQEALAMSAAWSRMMERLSASWPDTPHFYLMREVNASRLIAWRQKAQEQLGVKLTYTDLLVKLTAAALRRHPRVCAHIQDGQIWAGAEIGIGVAMATEDGLVVPVIHHADTLGLEEIAARRNVLVERARSGKLRLEDLQGGVFTISNLGMYDIDAFNAMINPGQAAILAVGRIAERVTPVNGHPGVQPMMTLSASFDHRIVDGARGAQFLKTLAEWIEEPLSLLR